MCGYNKLQLHQRHDISHHQKATEEGEAEDFPYHLLFCAIIEYNI